MSYDLAFAPRSRKRITAKVLAEHFSQFEQFEVLERSANYFNEDTGVYFTFELPGAKKRETAFTLNYCRPHTFALEAAAQLQAVVQQFDLQVDDPQTDGMGQGEFSLEGFFRGYNAGNRMACKAVSGEQEEAPLALPAAQIEGVWRWNLGRQQLQQKLGDEVFVPKISYVLTQQGLMTTAVWPDAIAVMLPLVDLVLIGREALAPPRGRKPGEPDLTIATWDRLQRVLGRYPMGQEPMMHHRLLWDTPPLDAADLIRSLESVPVEDHLEMVDPDSVLDAELLS